MTKQRLWQIKQKKLGLCPHCGKPKAKGYSKCKRYVLAARARYKKNKKPRKKNLE
jgi:hypothetical protein